jgi:hypothetical protein
MAVHDLRCERSATDPKRCRCECKGALHGHQASQIDLEHRAANLEQRRLHLTDRMDDISDDLEALTQLDGAR